MPAVGKVPRKSLQLDSGSPQLTSGSGGGRNARSGGGNNAQSGDQTGTGSFSLAQLGDRQACQAAGLAVMGATVAQLCDRPAGNIVDSIVMGSPVGKQVLAEAIPATRYLPSSSYCTSSSPLALASNLSQQDSCMSETLLMKTGSFSNSSSSQAMLHAQQAAPLASPLQSTATQLGSMSSPPALLRQLVSSPANSLLRQQAQLASLVQYPTNMPHHALQSSLPFASSFPVNFAMGIPLGVPVQHMATAQPQVPAPADGLAQLLAQHPQQCQPVPCKHFGPSINFDLDQMAMALEGHSSGLPSSLNSTSSNVSLASELLQSELLQSGQGQGQGLSETPAVTGQYHAPNMMLGSDGFINPLSSCDLLPNPVSHLDTEMLSRELEGDLHEHLNTDGVCAGGYSSVKSPFFSNSAQQTKFGNPCRATDVGHAVCAHVFCPNADQCYLHCIVVCVDLLYWTPIQF